MTFHHDKILLKYDMKKKSIIQNKLVPMRIRVTFQDYTAGISPAIRRGVKMHSLISKSTEMFSLIENTLLNLLNVTL